MPSPLPRQVRWSLFARPSPSSAAFPVKKFGSAPAIIVSGPAQRSLSLWPVRSRSRPATFSIESSDSFVASTAVSIATGWSEPVPGRELHPLKSSAFHGALFRQSRLVILLKPTDFGLAVRNTEPDVGKVLLNEMGERDDCFFFGCAERRYTFNVVLSIPNLSLESGGSSRNVSPSPKDFHRACGEQSCSPTIRMRIACGPSRRRKSSARSFQLMMQTSCSVIPKRA